MVTEKEICDRPQYSLARVQELAQAGDVAYGSSRVQHDVENLSYQLDDVCNCLLALCPADFRQGARYEERSPWLDVYRIKFRGPTGNLDDLYIKLKLDRACVLVLLASFHLDRNL